MSRDNANITRADELRPLAVSLGRSCTLLSELLERVEDDPDTWTYHDVVALHGLAKMLVTGIQYLGDKIDLIQHAEQAAQQMTGQFQPDTTPPRR